ncbi:MAG TPA: type I DNA topoisomerase [Acidimicrobiia bacterium]|nr:type I DNA topoisomerase [Acidimicrobiia bacterium]
MARSLVIVESPAKGKTISGYLGKDYTVMASIGHIRDLPRSKEEVPDDKKETHGRLAGIDPDDGFDACYVVPANKKKVVTELKAALKGADELILATDEDREGEAIGWHVLEVLKPKVPVRRMVFHEITPHAIQEALETPRDLDMKLVDAQEGRRKLDRIVGWETSPVLWRVFGRGQAASAGRVQSVAVRLVVERERARMRFRSGQWHDLEGTFISNEQPFRAVLADLDGKRIAQGRDFDPETGLLVAAAQGTVELLDETQAVALADRLRDVPYEITSTESDPFTERPRAPFTTSTLQQESGRKLRFTASRTMAVAQRLYERGYITYMRTDSTNLSEQAITAARTAIREQYGEDYLPNEPRTYRSKAKNAQEAHEAIRPAGDRIRTPDEVRAELDGDEQRLYELVWIRTVACQMADARGRKMTIRLAATTAQGERATFRASGKVYDFLGWRRAYVEDIDEGDEVEAEAVLPAVSEGDAAQCTELASVGHETKPPARYTEASLVKELEERGIGRPSTYAAVIETIQARSYVWRKGTALVPAWTAFAVTNLLERHFGHLVDYAFTATMEEALDAIAGGEGEAEKWLHSFYYGNGTPGLHELVSQEKLSTIDPRGVSTIPIGVDDTGHEIIVRVGRYGPYVQREDDQTGSLPPDIAPDELTVELALDIIAKQSEGPKSLGEDPETGLPVYALTGRFGPYVQLGEQEQGTKKKPKRASLFASMTPETVTLDEALQLLSLPRVVGVDAEEREIVASPGRFGPYLKRADGETRSLTAEEQLFTITLVEAEALYAQPKQRRGRQQKPPIAELGENPDNGAAVRVLEGRYGPYVTDGNVNATVPRGLDPAELTLDEAVGLLRAKADAAPTKKKATKKAAKKPAKKPAKKAAKKPAKKAAKKPAKKATKATKKTSGAAMKKATKTAEPPEDE